MSIGSIFMVIALVIFFLIGAHIVAIEMVWGFFALTLGLLLSGFPLPRLS